MTNLEHDFISPDISYEYLDTAHPRGILSWTAQSIDRLAIATSFQSSGLVILHLMTTIRADVPVLFLDTGFHFEETLEFKKQITEMWNLKIVDLRGEHGSVAGQARKYGPELYRRDPDRCCHINKVLPLQNALEEYDGWVSGLRRDQSPLRAETPIVEAQMLPSGNEIMKIHPLAHWTKADVEGYIAENDIPTHPLLEKGFGSIGCWPCTRAINDNEQERDGRWSGNTKTECGIHTFGRDHGPKETEADQ
jgi:phosphoadenosine phosphosulfate reductase